MDSKTNVFLNKLTLILVRVGAIIGFLWQILQYFTGRWADEWYKEVGMLILLFIFARYPKEILSLFKKKTNL